jgi:hypothetical protein
LNIYQYELDKGKLASDKIATNQVGKVFFMHKKLFRFVFSIIVALSLLFSTQSANSLTCSQDVGTYRWQDGCTQDNSVCGSIKIKYGLALLSLIAHGVSVDIVLVDTGKVIAVAAAVGNTTKQPIFILPEQINLYDVEVISRKLKLLDSESLAKKKDKGDVSEGDQIITAIDLVKSRVSVDNGLSPFRLPRINPSRNIIEDTDAKVIREAALRGDSLPSKKFVVGVVFFESDKKVNNLLLSIPIGGYVFEFPFVRNL